MKWFKHDTDANMDAKLMRVRHKYGMVGYGLYWYCVELIARDVSSSNISFELEHDAATIAREWGLDQLTVEEMMTFMVNSGLFEESNGVITCLKLAHRLDDTNAKNPQIKMLQQSVRTNSEKLRETPRNSGQIRLDKNRRDKREGSRRFAPPSLEDVASFCRERKNGIDPESFLNFYQSKNWMVGKNKMSDWRSAVLTWEKRRGEQPKESDPFQGAK